MTTKPMKRMAIPIAADEHEVLAARAKRAGTSLANYVRLAIGATGTAETETLRGALDAAERTISGIERRLAIAAGRPPPPRTPVEAVLDLVQRLEVIAGAVPGGGE